MGTQSKLNELFNTSSADEAINNYNYAKREMYRALSKNCVVDDVVYFAARTIVSTYETAKKIAPDRLVFLADDDTLEKAANGEISLAEAMKSLVSKAVNAKITKLFDGVADDLCDCEYDEQISKTDKGSTYYKCDRDNEKCDERLVVRDADKEIIAQIHLVASEIDANSMTVYADVWAGDGADDLTERQLRNRVVKEVRKIVQDEDDDEDLLQVKIKIVEEPLFDLDFGLSLCE